MSCGFLQTCIALAKHRDRVESDAKVIARPQNKFDSFICKCLAGGDSCGIILTELFETKKYFKYKM